MTITNEDIDRIATRVADVLEERKEARRVVERKEQCWFCANGYPMRPGSNAHEFQGIHEWCTANPRLLP